MITIFVLILIIIVLLALYVYRESNGYHIVSYSFTDLRVKKEKLTLVFLSDLHNRQYGDKNVKLLEDIEKINPDYVIIGGDMITSCMERFTGYDDTMSFIKSLTDRFRVIYGMGNHEERLRRVPDKFPEGIYEDLVKKTSEMGCPILVNERVSLDCGVDIYGLDLDHKYYRKFVTRAIPDDYMKEKLGTLDDERFNILLAHNPEHFKTYAKWGADLTLSGHVHGGIVRLPLLGGVVSPALKLFPKYDGGLFREGKAYMVLSRGIGTHTIPIRINNKAELVVIEITGEQDK